MKNILLIILSAIIVVNCGPKASELEAQRIADSTMMADSLSMVMAEMQKEAVANELNLSTKTPSDKKFVKTANLKFRVKNVLQSTEKVEDLAFKYDGYLTYSKLENKDQYYRSSRISRDSLLVSKQIVVVNEMQLRIPNERLDSFVRDLNSLVAFLDHRIIKLDDVTFNFIANSKRTARLNKYEQRQTKHIDSRDEKLKSTTAAEENLLDRQNEADDLMVKSLALEDRLKYCDISIDIYQKPVIIQEVIADFDYAAEGRPGFGSRLWDSLVAGWNVLEEVVLFIIKLWGLILLTIGIFFSVVYLRVVFKHIKKKLYKG